MSNKLSRLIKLTSIIFLASISYNATAEWHYGLDVLTVKSDNSKKVNALVGVAGYQFKLSNKLVIIPEISIGTGVKKRHINKEEKKKLKLTYYFSGAIRGRYQVTDKFFVVAGPLMNKARFKITQGEITKERNGKWRLGFNAGVGYQLSSTLSAELSYGKTKDTNIWQAGLRYSF